MNKLTDQDWCDLVWLDSLQKTHTFSDQILKDSWIEARKQSKGALDTALRRARFLNQAVSVDYGEPPRTKKLFTQIFWIVMGLAFLGGLASNVLGGSQSVNLLSNPMTALLVWQLIVILIWAFRAILIRKAAESVRGIGALSVRVFEWVALRSKHNPTPRQAVLKRFWQSWLGHHKVKVLALASRCLHLGFCFLVIGCLVGLYLRGIASSYGFIWESTFIDHATTVQWLADHFFWLPSKMFFLKVPGVLETGTWMPGAPWIHLFAAAFMTYILVPRLVMLALAQRQYTLKLSQLQRPYLAGLIAEAELVDIARVVVLAHSYHLDKRHAAWLENRILASLEHSTLHWVHVDWGEELDESERLSNAWVVVVFNGAHTPEQEVQGAFLDEVRRMASPARISVVVDSSALTEEQWEPRKLLWTQLCAEHQLKIVWLNMAAEPSALIVEQELATAAVACP